MVLVRFPARHRTVPLRRRVALTVVRHDEVRGRGVERSPIELRAICGPGLLVYVCGSCGHGLAVGPRPGSFATALFACGCGAVNQVPLRRARA